MDQQHIRNIAIVAHVDHGKTSLVDAMLKQTKTFAAHQREMGQTTIMDSNELERERGVTILSKNTAVFWNEYKINILDTPGHADFSGEVERVLNMADGCILLVDAAEGVLSQTKFVLRLALELGLRPMVVINKVDRKDQRAGEVEHEIADLFLELATDEAQLDFPVLYARGIEGIAGRQVAEEPDHSLKITDSTDLTPLFETIVAHVPAPEGDPAAPLQLQVNSLDWDNHKGKISIGRIFQGTIKKGQRVALVSPTGEAQPAKIEYLFTHHGLERTEVDEVAAGDIIAVAGIEAPKIGDTITDPQHPQPLPALSISEPTVKMRMSVNTSPFAGRDAEFSTSRQLRDRLTRELETNVGLRVSASESGESVTLVGRGEMHLGILIETMRREGYEFSLSRPEVVLKEVDGQTLEPWESVIIEVPEDYTGSITSSMAQRKAEMKNMKKTKNGVRMEYEIATSNLIGYRSELLTNTSGQGLLHSTFLEYRPMAGKAEWYRGGAIIAQEMGQVTAYALEKLQQRAKSLVNPGEEVYPGQVVGINTRSEDMVFNITRGKKLTNMRASSADATVVIAPAWKPSLEQFLTLIAEDEMLEVTPQDLRLRKKDITQALKR
ncbi:MAG TPA: translational GTPase TypA [Patescibacteria group bacterium]